MTVVNNKITLIITLLMATTCFLWFISRSDSTAVTNNDRPRLIYSIEYQSNGLNHDTDPSRLIFAVWSNGSCVGYSDRTYKTAQVGGKDASFAQSLINDIKDNMIEGNHTPPGSSYYKIVIGSGTNRQQVNWNGDVVYLPQSPTERERFLENWARISLYTNL
ncbi:hypothetical protein MNBD_GAMMA13-491, partial [hydrothermal vent metagenome]